MKELKRDEVLWWAGQPDRTVTWLGRITRAAMAIAALGFGGFGLFLHSRREFGSQGFIAIGVVLSILTVFAYLWSWWTQREGRLRIYAVTSERALCIHGSRRTLRVDSYPARQLAVFRQSETARGTGDLVFWSHYRKFSDGQQLRQYLGFDAVPGVVGVERLVSKLIRSARDIGGAAPSDAVIRSPSLHSLPRSLQERLRSELAPGEALIWAGQPVPGRAMKHAFGLWFFFVPWTLMVCMAFAFNPAARTGGSLNHMMIILLIIGLLGLGLPWLWRRAAQEAVYALTSERAIVLAGVDGTAVESFPASELAVIERVEHRDGSGDLIFWDPIFNSDQVVSTSHRRGFMHIARVREIELWIDGLVRPGAARAVPVQE